MSSASSAPPWRCGCRRPPSCCCRRRISASLSAHGSGAGQAARAAARGAAWRRSTTSGPGSAGWREGLALVRRVPLGAAGIQEGEQRGRQQVVHQAESRLHSRLLALQREEHRERARAASPLPSTATGALRSSRYSGGAAPSAASPAVDPLGVGAQERALAPPAGASTARAATARSRSTRTSRSAVRAAGPKSSESSPAARRRMRSIWKKRSCACRKPVARATSARLRPRTTGHAVRVALDTDGRGEARQLSLAVELRQAGLEALPQVRVGAARDDHEQREHAAQRDEPAPPCDGQRHACPRVWFATAWAARFAASGSPR